MSRRRIAGIAALAAAVTLAGGIPRILLSSGTLVGGLRPFVWSDVLFVYERGLTGHRLPYVDTPFEYPPLTGAISALLSLAAPAPAWFVTAWAILVALAAAVCAAVLAAHAGAGRTLRYFVLTPQLFLLGTVNFDLVPVALVAFAAVSQRTRRDLASMAALALGTVAKLYPAASVPLAWWRSSRRSAAALVFALVIGAFYVPTVLQPASSAGGIAFYAVGIPANMDSVWGLLEGGLRAFGVGAAGSVVLAVTIAGLVVSYVALVVPRALRDRDPVVGICLATVALLFWSRLYSPQYSLWLLPFFVLLGIAPRVFALLTVADVGVFFSIYPLTLVERQPGDAGSTFLLGALAAFVVLRHVALWRIWISVTAPRTDVIARQ